MVTGRSTSLRVGARVAMAIALLALAACGMLAPAERSVGVQSALRTLSLTEGDFHCAEPPPAPNLPTYEDCVGIPIIVLVKPSGGCLALVPYVNLIVHTGGKRTKVVWKIRGNAEYRFDSTKGIALTKVPGTTDPTEPTDIYDSRLNQNDRYKWEVKPAATRNKKFAHVANVIDGVGRPCEWADPVIVNTDN